MAAYKFEDCRTCRFRRRRDICRGCDVGELYEDEDRPGVDQVFREVPLRFGESVIADDDDDRRRHVDLNSLVERMGGEWDGETGDDDDDRGA